MCFPSFVGTGFPRKKAMCPYVRMWFKKNHASLRLKNALRKQTPKAFNICESYTVLASIGSVFYMILFLSHQSHITLNHLYMTINKFHFSQVNKYTWIQRTSILESIPSCSRRIDVKVSMLKKCRSPTIVNF